MRLRRWKTISALIAVAMTTALVGCATSSPSTARAPLPAGSPISSQATERNPSPTAVGAAPACTAAAGAARLGDLAITPPTVLYGFNADYMLPDGLPTDKPLAVTLRDNELYALGGAVESRPVVQATFVIGVCNTSSTHTHRLTSFGIMLDSLTAYSGQLNVLNGCAFLYGRPSGAGGECASGYSPDLNLSFQLPGSATPRATVTQNPSAPIEMAPGHGLDISLDISPPSLPAIATYRVGLGADGAALVYPSALVTQPRLIAPIARRWAGNFCTLAQMQAQIPAVIPANTYYVCAQV